MTVVETTPKPVPKPIPDPDRLLKMAKRAVVENFNDHRDPAKSKPLSMVNMHIVSYSYALGSWHAVISSPVARGLLWNVISDEDPGILHLEVYKKMNSVRINRGGK